uniref:Centrosomin N-terminal motif 1 domain-containing protein n=1 Tax=Anas zonorhyncha TaxID=75864 RepID=A0A8B9V5H9_9AVES
MANGYRTLSQHLNDLKKENFSLKLRIYFLEERVQQKGEGSRDDVYRRVSHLRDGAEHPEDDTDQSNRSEAALRQHYEERQRESEHVYELLENKIQLLQEVSAGGRGGAGAGGRCRSPGLTGCCAGGQAGQERGGAGHRAGQG